MGSKPGARREDPRLIAGRGGYVADHLPPGARVAGFLRSSVASGRIATLDTAEAAALPGVVAIFTAADLDADGIGPLSHEKLPRDDGGTPGDYPQPILAGDRVAYVGQCIALVVAEDPGALADALEAIEIDIDEEDAPSGTAFLRRVGDADAVRAEFDAAAHRVTVALDIPRVTAFALEPRGAIASIGADGRLDYRASTQNPYAIRSQLAAQLGIEPGSIRVRADDVGGSFGLKGFMAPEDAALAWAVRRLGGTLAWLPSRSDTILGDAQGRGATAEVSLALADDLRIRAIEARFVIDAGAYPSRRSCGVINNINGLTGMYDIPAAAAEIEGRLSARPPLAPFRGNGRPEATHAIERALDAAARKIGADPVELRRRNLIPTDAMPLTTALGTGIDSGDFERVMNAALELNAGAEGRRQAAEARGMLYGLGLANCIESSGGPLRQPKPDYARLTVSADGNVTVAPGVMSVGQGHETGLSAMAAGALEIAPERIVYHHGDTDAITTGRGSGGSSGLTVAGSAMHEALNELIEDGARRAAPHLGCAPEDIVYRDGAFHLEGSNQALDLAALASREGGSWSLETSFTPDAATFPNGTHICEVEIDPETGETRVTRYAAVEDVGRVLNPVLVEGQLHGGIAQGLSLGLGERIAHDADGQLLTGTLMDYQLVRAGDLPAFRLASVEVPTQLNPLGVKGVGEAGSVGATAALASAVSDALARAGVEDFDLPATACRVWEALAAARAAQG